MALRREANFIYLLAGLLVVLVAGPVFNDVSGRQLMIVTPIAFSVTLIVGIWSLIDSRKWFMIGMCMVTMNIVFTVIHVIRPSLAVDTFSLLATLAFCAMSLVITLRHVLLDHRMTLNRLIGGVCAYLLLGVSIAILNMLVQRFIPHSFTGLPDPDVYSSGMDLIYYSFVTMTTLGYGDIIPESSIARALAYLTAIAGQFYIAILVGTSVGMYLNQRQTDNQHPPG